MMKGKIAALLALFASAVAVSADSLEKDFKNPPPDARAETWWHFTTNHITKEGITRDLEAIKNIGYSGAHIFIPNCYGKIPNVPDAQIMTPLWRELMRHAGAEAKRLGLSIGVHNCPGWSSSGGPWIKPEDSMKFIVHSQKRISGKQSAPITLAPPPANSGFYRDIAVLAIPANKIPPTPKISTVPETANPNALSDEENKNSFKLPIENEGGKASVLLEFPESVEARTAELCFEGKRIHFEADAYASDDGKNFRKVGTLSYNHSNDIGIPKFLSFGPTAVKAKFFRFDFSYKKVAPWNKSKTPINLKSIKLYNESTIPNVQTANSSETTYAYKPPVGKPDTKAPAVSEILDLTGKMSPDGKLNWTGDGKDWIILRIGYTTTNRHNAPTTYSGLECDKLSKRGLDAHWPHYMGVLESDIGSQGVLKYSTIDSFEVGGQNWTEGFDAEFKKRRGYDILKWLPAAIGYTVESPAKSSRFLFDLQTTVADLFAENYFDYFTKLCHDRGMLSILESYGGGFDDIRCSRTADIPTSEFWLSGGTTGRHAHSAANFHGRRSAGAESFTTGDGYDGYWRQHPRMLKDSGDIMWTEGTNAIIVHSYVHQPLVNVRPGLALGPHGSHINVNTTWWKDGKAWVDYLNRAQTLLQRGRVPSDVLILAGESLPNRRTRVTSYDWPVVYAGYYFDFCSPKDLLDSIKISDGKIVAPSGVKYSVFSLAEEIRPTLNTLKAVKKMLDAGIAVCGMRPIGSPSLSDDDAEYAKLVNEIWGADNSKNPRKVGKGTLYPEVSALRALTDLKIEPVISAAKNFKCIARVCDEASIYFIVNTNMSNANGEFSIRANGDKTPEIWNPATGEIKPLPQWKRDGQTIKFSLEFDPKESEFIVLRDRAEQKHFEKFSAQKAEGYVKPENIDIIEAKYRLRGTKEGGKDVKEILEKVYPDGFSVSNRLFGDPYPNKFKELYIKYKVGKRETEEIVYESENHFWKGLEWMPPQSIYPTVLDGAPAMVFEINGSAEGELSDGAKFSTKVGNLPRPIKLSSDWSVEFAKDLGAPEGEIAFDKLVSWTERPEFGIKYFSGTAKYSKSFDIPEDFISKNRKVLLSLGEVRETARVKVNGKDAGILWKIPYEVDITNLVKPGKNTVEVEVTNLWYNRLVGDEIKSPLKAGETPKWVLEGKSRADDNSRYTFTLSKGWTAESKPMPSGLIGPVEIRAAEVVKAD